MQYAGHRGGASLEAFPLDAEDQPDPLTEAPGGEGAGLRERIRQVAPQDTPVLLTGESGTGKTRLARSLHEHSPRREEPFLVVDCGALSATPLERELFGHVRGGFAGADRDRRGKFAAAGRGTLLLDEIHSLPLALQGRLLRAVDERGFRPVGADRPRRLHARLVAATGVSLGQEVAAGRFRADLYDRLSGTEFNLPPLRARRGAIPNLARRFLVGFVRRDRPDLTAVTAEALTALREYDWPGNIRELRNVLERAVALSDGPVLGLEDLPEAIRGNFLTSPAAAPGRREGEARVCGRLVGAR